MVQNSIEFNQVWKKFRKGEKLNSLRDAIPNMFKREDRNSKLEDREFWAVKDVSFDIKQGDVVGVMGPNGAGKSTILKLLSRIIKPNKGSMKINGRLSALIEVTAGFHPELTGRENVYLNGTILGMRRKEIDSKFDQIVEFSGVGEFIDTPIKRYSSGMFSRLGFSVAAHMDPDILLVDEVLSVGDIAFQARCAKKIRELLKSNATIILVSHQLNMIQSLCKRIILLQNGQVLKDGKTDEVIPLYQNIIYKKDEEDLKKKMTDGVRVRVDTSPLIEINYVRFIDQTGQEKEKFLADETIKIMVDFKTKKLIEEPIFILEVMRADGILCFSCRSDESGARFEAIEGEGKICADIGQSHLTPGIYMAQLAVWDKDMIHPYIVRNKDVIRIEANGRNSESEAVVVHPVAWDMKK